MSSSEALVDSEEDFNVLVMGKHGSNVDSLIYVNLDETSQTVTLISIPRDLYFQGRRINSVYAEYGVQEQVRWVEDIVGYKMDHYILIDMYVFRDVVDLMGGVDIVLQENLIDPTYKVCEGELCSTLYYEAGGHHLNGTEALRIARSRHTTSDYSRAARQQLILEGIKNKAMSLGLSDANTLFSILSTVVDSTETDINLDEAIRYLFRYQNFTLGDGGVLSTANVLDAEPIPVSYETSHAIQTCLDETRPETCTDGFAIDVLQPIGGDWDLIRGYVREILGE